MKETVEEIIKNAVQRDEISPENLQTIQRDIVSGSLKLSDFVESLGFALTSTEIQSRANSTKLLSNTLTLLPVNQLNETELNYITTFYCDRIKDHHSVLPGVFIGMLAIIQMKNLPNLASVRILQSIFQHINVQSQTRPDRSVIFNIIQILTENQQDDLITMGTDLVYGVINAIDGERDPRILLKIFQFLPKFLLNFELGHLAEEMFEVCACYFPVDFHPVQEDPKIQAPPITRDILAEELAACLSGNENFAEFCIPLLLEKMDSQLMLAKLDSLSLLSKSAIKFSPICIEKQFDDIWLALKVELLTTAGNKEITLAALESLKNITASATKEPLICTNIVKKIFETILPNLSDVNAHLFSPSIRIAIVVARSSKFCYEIVTKRLLPTLITQLHINHDNPIQRSTILNLIVQLLIIEFDKPNDENNDDDGSAAANNKIDQQLLNEIFKVLLDENCDSTAQDIDLIQTCLSALKKMVNLIDSIVERQRVYNSIIKYLKIQKYFEQTLDVLYAYAEKYPQEILTNIFMDLISKKYENLEQANYLIKTISHLISVEFFTERVIHFMFGNIFEQIDSDVRQLTLTNLRNILTKSESNTITQTLPIILHKKHNLINKFIIFIQSNTTDINNSIITSPNPALIYISDILSLIIQSIEIDDQKMIIENYLPSTLNLALTNEKLYLLSGLLKSLNSTVNLDQYFNEIINQLIQYATTTTVNDTKHLDHLQEITNNLLSTLFNKMSITKECQSLNDCVQILTKESNVLLNYKAIITIAWITKGLLVNGHQMAIKLIELIHQMLLSNNKRCRQAAIQSFNIISQDSNIKQLPIQRPLFKQKLFHLLLKRTEITSASVEQIIAISFVFKSTPQQILKMNINKVGPILFRCLNLLSSEVSSSSLSTSSSPSSSLSSEETNINTTDASTAILSSLNIIQIFINDLDEYFHLHLNRLINSCLTLSKSKYLLKIRVAALECLSTITKYDSIILMPFKIDVLHELRLPLDDTKRIVRKAAVDTRNRWFLLGASK